MIVFPPNYQKKYLLLEKQKIELKISLLEIELNQVLIQRRLLEKMRVSSQNLQKNSRNNFLEKVNPL